MNNNDPIRVLHVVTHLNRNGLESRIMDIYRNIDRNQIQFDFMIHRNDMGDFGKEIKSLGGKIYVMRRFSPKTFLKYLNELDHFFDEHKEYKIVHAHLNSMSTWVLRAAKRHDIPIRIAHSRNSSLDHNIRALPKWISKQFINRYTTDRFGCSQMAGDWLFGKKYSYGDTFRVIPNAIQVDKFIWNPETRLTKRQELGLNDEIAVIDVARLSDQKNHEYLLRVYAEIKKRLPNSKLFLAGSGEKETMIRQFAKEHNLEKDVILLGSRSDVADLYQAMDMFLFPSKFEGFGTVIIEAQMTNLLTIASDTIPQETKLCDCVEFLPITADPETWAEKAVSMLRSDNRKDNLKIIQEAGYDIRQQYRIMQDFYLKKVNELRK